MPVDKLTIAQFAQKLKDKYPDYKDMNDTILTQKVIDKHPEYKDMVDMSPAPTPSLVDQGMQQTTDKLAQPIQFTGTFQPDLEGEKNGLYLNDPDYQKQKQDFVSKILTDDKGNLMYPEQDDKGNWSNYYTKQPIENFNAHDMSGKILQVPHEYLPATGGKKFITPVYNAKTNAYDFPGVETPSVPHQQELEPATVYPSQNGKNSPRGTDSQYAELQGLSPEVNSMLDESDKQGGQLRAVVKENPQLAQDIDAALNKYGEPYKESLATGSPAMTNVIKKTIEDKYGMNEPMNPNVDQNILNSQLAVLNNFDKNRAQFEGQQKELQRQADLMTDKSKRDGTPLTQADADRINQRAQDNASTFETYKKAVISAQNYVNQPDVKNYLDQAQKKQQGFQLMDEVNQRAFPKDTENELAQDEYNRKGIEGNLGLMDYLKTGLGSAAKGISNIAETYNKMQGVPSQIAEASNNQAQTWLSKNLPALTPEAIDEMNKGGHGISTTLNDLSSMVGSFAPYMIPGMAEEGLGAKGATFATALASSLPDVKKQALDLGLTGKAYATFLTTKPLVDAAFMSLLPNVKFAKGYEGDVANAVVNGELNSPKKFLMNMAEKAFKNPEDVAHLQTMLSGTEIGNALVNKLTNSLQVSEDAQRGIKRSGDPLSVDLSNVFNPKQTATAVLAGKILETVPNAANAAGEYKTSKEIGKTYDAAQNNMVELAANDLQGTSDKIAAILKKDPGNIYAQHIKGTLEDFAYAKSMMPEGLSPEQQAALFDVQSKVSNMQRQKDGTVEDYKPHIQKNIDEIKKQIPDIINDQQVALKYLEPAHKALAAHLQSPKIETDGKDQTAQTDQDGQAQGQVDQPEGAEIGSGAAPSYLISRHADTIKDEEGKTSGPNQHPLSPDGKKDANDLATEVQAQAEKTGIPVTKIVHSGLERSGETARKVAEKTGAETVSDPKLNTWDIGQFDDASDDDFKEVQKWFGNHPDEKKYDGPIEKFKGKELGETLNEYAKRTIDAHAPYEKEPASTLMIDHSNNMMVMDAYRKNGNKWDENAIHDYLNSEKPEPATLVQPEKPHITVSTPNIVNVKLKDNAVQIGQPASVGAHADGDTGSRGAGEGSGVGSGQQGNEPAGESGKEKENPGKEEDDLPFIEEEGDNDFTSLKNEVTKGKVEDAGLKPAMQEAAREFGTVWKDAQKKLHKGYDIEKLIKDLGKKPRPVTDTENAMILYHQNVKEAQLDAASKELDQARKDGDRDKWNDAYNTRAKLLDDLQDIYNVDKSIGRENARGLNARKMMADRRFSLVNMQLEKRASAGGEPLTEEQTAQVQKQYEDIKKAKAALDERVNELQKENDRLKQEATVRKMERQVRDEKVQVKKEKIQKNLADSFAQLKKIAKEQGSKLSSNPLPAEAIPVIGQIAKNLIRLGITKIEGIANHIFDAIKDDYAGVTPDNIMEAIQMAGDQEKLENLKERRGEQITDIQNKLTNQDFSKKPPPRNFALDPRAQKLNAAYERAKGAYEQGLKKDQLQTRTGFQKIQDSFLKYERFAKLSNPITLGKLSMAALTRLSTTPLEEGVGAVYSKILPGIAKKAPGEAGFNAKALGKGYAASFMKGLDDAAKVLKSGKSDIDAVYGKKGHLPPEAIDFFGQLHSAIKAPVKRFAFERSFAKRMANNIKNGTPIDGMVEARIAVEAYKDAERSIFMQDNAVSRGWSNMISGLERSETPGAKELATAAQWLIPFVKVPTNILGETISHVAGPEIAAYKIIRAGLGKGLKNLDQDEAESIMRNLKKGTIGHGALMIGYLNPKAFGGYYQQDEKIKPGDVKPGDLKLFGHTIPAWMLEAPIFQAMQVGATVRRLKDEKVKGQEKGIGEGIWGGALGLMSHEPLIDEPSRLGGMMASPTQRQYFMGELAKSTLVPAASDYAAKVTDPLDKRPLANKMIEPENDRKPETIKEHVESAIPGLRENVGVKKPTGHRQRQHR
jgi:broad specificity phosphatase PhoE